MADGVHMIREVRDGEGAIASERGAPAPQKLATIASDIVLSRAGRSRFIYRADHGAGNRELDQVAGDPAAENLGRQRLYRESNQVSATIY